MLPSEILPPDPVALAAFLDRYAPLKPAPLAPEISVFQSLELMPTWQGAEDLAGHTLPAPFWAYAWAGGVALARALLDRPEVVRGGTVLDVGCGGGVVALAAARAGAERVVANDFDPWALATTRLAAERQGLRVDTLLADLTAEPAPARGFDVVVCGDLEYDRRVAPKLRALLVGLHAAGARVLLADAGRRYFSADGLRLLAEHRVAVPRDLEGVAERTARAFELV